jgi:hypothetical protein
MEQTLGCALIFTITLPVSFYAARGCLRGLVCLIYRSSRASRSHALETIQSDALAAPISESPL